MPIKIGDKVKVINKGLFYEEIEVGDIGEITRVDSHSKCYTCELRGCSQTFCKAHIGQYVEIISMATVDVTEVFSSSILKDIENTQSKINGETEKEIQKQYEFDEEETNTGKVMYSTLFVGGKEYLETSNKPDLCLDSIYHDSKSWPKEHQAFIPVLDTDYIWQHDVLYPFMLGMLKKLKVQIVGPTGSGKTAMVKNIAASLNQPYYRLGGRVDLESDSILGKPWIANGTMSWMDGEFVTAYRSGYLCTIDEFTKIPAGIQMTLQRVYERDGILQLDDKPGSLADKQVTPHPSTYITLCDNVVGTGDGADKYGATLIQDGSTLNRMDLVLQLGYLKAEDEVKFIMAKYPFVKKKDMAKKIVQLATSLRNAHNLNQLPVTMSPRNIMAWIEMAYQIRDWKQGFRWTMLERYASDADKEAVRGAWTSVFGDEL